MDKHITPSSRRTLVKDVWEDNVAELLQMRLKLNGVYTLSYYLPFGVVVPLGKSFQFKQISLPPEAEHAKQSILSAKKPLYNNKIERKAIAGILIIRLSTRCKPYVEFTQCSTGSKASANAIR